MPRQASTAPLASVARHSIEKQSNRSERFEWFIPSDTGCPNASRLVSREQWQRKGSHQRAHVFVEPQLPDD
jgi:hypothetical protein